MKKRRSDHRHVRAGILLSCVLLLLASAGMAGSEPAGQTAMDGQTTAATPPNEITVALKEISVWELATERVRPSARPIQPVTIERHGRLLVLTYGPKPGAGGLMPSTGVRGEPPRFAVYQGQRQVASGQFEYG